MPALTITAVDNATDQLTSVGHGLLTGAGPAAVRNIDGALPAPLAALTDYWVIRVDADTVKLAASSADALAGTPINLTTNGTGTQILEVGLPYRRAVTHVANVSQVKAATLDAMQDSLKALHAYLTGQAQTVWSPGNAIMNVSPVAGDGAGWAWDAANGYLLSSGAGTWSIGIPTIVGMVVKSITFERWGDGAADLTGGIYKRVKGGVPGGPLFAISAVNPAAAWVDEVCDLTDMDIADGDAVWIALTASAANLRIGEIRVTYKRAI
jgi:hypothetical protein